MKILQSLVFLFLFSSSLIHAQEDKPVYPNFSCFNKSPRQSSLRIEEGSPFIAIDESFEGDRNLKYFFLENLPADLIDAKVNQIKITIPASNTHCEQIIVNYLVSCQAFNQEAKISAIVEATQNQKPVFFELSKKMLIQKLSLKSTLSNRSSGGSFSVGNGSVTLTMDQVNIDAQFDISIGDRSGTLKWKTFFYMSGDETSNCSAL